MSHIVIGQDRWDDSKSRQHAYGMFVTPNQHPAAVHRLDGKRAMLVMQGDLVYAQFDDVKTGYGYGWHVFPRVHFKILYNYTGEL